MTRFKSFASIERRRAVGAGLVILVGFTAMSCRAAEPDDLQVHGFLTQGYVNTTENRFFGDSKHGSFEFTEIGVNASYRATPTVLFAGQLLSRRAGDMYDGSPTVDYALVDWSIVNSADYSFGVMVGRTKNALGLYNDTRDVAFTRPSIFLPQQIYFDQVRNLILSADGIQLYARIRDDRGNWLFSVGAGDSPVDQNVEISFLGADFGGSLDTGRPTQFARGEYESPDGAWRLALSAAKVGLDFTAAAGDPIGPGSFDFVYWIASAQYNAERWTLTAEYMEEPLHVTGFGPPLDGGNGTVQGYYLQGSYLWRDDIEWVVRYAAGYADKGDRDGQQQSAATGGFLPAHAFFQTSWTLGMRWDVTPSLMLRAEYQWNDGTWTLPRRENPIPSATARDWDIFSILASYRF